MISILYYFTLSINIFIYFFLYLSLFILYLLVYNRFIVNYFLHITIAFIIIWVFVISLFDYTFLFNIKPFFHEKFSNLFFSINDEYESILWDMRIKKQLNICSLIKKTENNNQNLILFENNSDFSEFISGFDNGLIQVFIFFIISKEKIK